MNRLPREAVDALSLEALKATLDRALGSLNWWVAALPIAGNRCYSRFLSNQAVRNDSVVLTFFNLVLG